MNGDLKIGRLLCDEDVITRRQLNQALQDQVQGDKRTIGEILVDKGFCTLDDITTVIMEHGNGHEEKQEEISEKIEKKEAKEISEDTKFTMSIQTMVAIGTGIASLVGMYYMLIGEIEEAKELPSLESLYQADMDEAFGDIEDMKDIIKELQKDIKDLEKRKRDK
jgi:hypothetical protein